MKGKSMVSYTKEQLEEYHRTKAQEAKVRAEASEANASRLAASADRRQARREARKHRNDQGMHSTLAKLAAQGLHS